MSVHTYSLFPIQDRGIFLLGKKQEARFWTVKDLKKFNTDREDYLHKANRSERRLLKRVHMLFIPADGVINKGHMIRTAMDCTSQDEQYAMAFQFAIEAVHAETYGLSAQVIFGNECIKKLKIKAESVQVIQDKIRFAEKYSMDRNYSYTEYLLAFACTEGIFISVSFIFIFWFRSKGMMPALIHANSMISEDEQLHQEMANYRYLKHGGLSQERELEIIMEAMKIEERYIDWILPEAIDDLRPEDVKTYLKLIVDYQLVSLGRPKMFNVTNPFAWDQDRSLFKKHNPYERDSGAYCRFSVNEYIDMIDNLDTYGNETHLTDPWSIEDI